MNIYLRCKIVSLISTFQERESNYKLISSYKLVYVKTGDHGGRSCFLSLVRLMAKTNLKALFPDASRHIIRIHLQSLASFSLAKAEFVMVSFIDFIHQ
jgi:hypothetical protein